MEIERMPSLTDIELLQTISCAQNALRSRGVIRSANTTGDYAEYLFSKAFGWQLERNSNAGFDALDGKIRYQIKCRRITDQNPSRQLGEFGSLPDKRFDVLAAVLFLSDFTVFRAALVPFDIVLQQSSIVLKRHRFHLRDTIWDIPQVLDVTEKLRSAQEPNSPLLLPKSAPTQR
jgi:hypothetical protein